MEVESLRSMRSFVANEFEVEVSKVRKDLFRWFEKNPPRPLGTPPVEGIVPEVGKADVFRVDSRDWRSKRSWFSKVWKSFDGITG